MLLEPRIDRTELLRVVRAAYGLELDRLEYLSEGSVHAYRASGASGRYFLKLFPDTILGREMAARMDGEHGLLIALRETRALPRVPEVLRTFSGLTRSSFSGWPLAMYQFIEGKTIWVGWEERVPQIAEILGQLHASANQLQARGLELPVPDEDFGLPFESGLLEMMERLENPGSSATVGVRALRDLLRPRRDELLSLLARARALRDLARSKARALVVAHTDLHGGNLLLDPTGQLWALDWETARLAPPEHDLHLYHSRLEAFLPAYEAALGAPARLDADVFGFYMYRRNLEDLAVSAAEIVETDADEQNLRDLEIIEQHVLDAWPRLEPRLTGVRRVLCEMKTRS